ncbi:MAG: single-stranded DNA-binding protein [Kiritimatiellae bacterium]|jgi:single-strand DNA-binding protein|nr:single-stranded DNA-binding protein [Kiritimatiellia bacterium]
MASLNQVFLLGNLTADPEVRYISSGNAVCELRMAVNRRYKTRDGQDAEEVCYVSVDVWGKQAENCGKYLNKGSGVLVSGRLKFDSWEKDGQKFSRLKVTATNVQFMSRGNHEQSGGGNHQQNAGGYSQPQQTQQSYGGQSAQQQAPAPQPQYNNDVDFVNDTGDDDSLPF